MAVTCNTANIKSVSGICKVVETCLLLIAITIQRTTLANFGTPDATIFGLGVLVAGLIITPILLLCYIIDKTIIRSSILEPVLNAALSGLLIIAAVLCLSYWRSHYVSNNSTIRTSGLALGSMTLLASFTYFVDGVFACLLYCRSK